MAKSPIDYTSDAARLPENLERIAYDADTQIYSYRDTSTNEHWQGEPGNQFGQLRRVPTDPKPYLFASDDLPEFVLDPLAQLPDTNWEPGTSLAGSSESQSGEKSLSRRASKAWRRVFGRLRVDLKGVEEAAAAGEEGFGRGRGGVLLGEKEKAVLVVNVDEKVRDSEKDSM